MKITLRLSTRDSGHMGADGVFGEPARIYAELLENSEVRHTVRAALRVAEGLDAMLAVEFDNDKESGRCPDPKELEFFIEYPGSDSLGFHLSVRHSVLGCTRARPVCFMGQPAPDQPLHLVRPPVKLQIVPIPSDEPRYENPEGFTIKTLLDDVLLLCREAVPAV